MHGLLAAWLRPAPIAAVALMVAVGCGSDDDSKKSASASAEHGASRAPNELLGTYTTELKRSDLPPNPPPELTSGSMVWELTIANSGGLNNGPVFAIANTESGALEGPSFGVNGDRILLHREECAAGGDVHFYENVYRYKLSGETLVLTKVKNACPDKVALTILTSEPWTRKD
jgi:hypothetical protein